MDMSELRSTHRIFLLAESTTEKGGKEMSEGIVKIRAKYVAPYRSKPKRVSPGHCRLCGAKLIDELSLKRGYGRCCWSNHVVLILEIEPKTPSA
jgi:hypothetical protein